MNNRWCRVLKLNEQEQQFPDVGHAHHVPKRNKKLWHKLENTLLYYKLGRHDDIIQRRIIVNQTKTSKYIHK